MISLPQKRGEVGRQGPLVVRDQNSTFSGGEMENRFIVQVVQLGGLRGLKVDCGFAAIGRSDN